MALMRAPLGQRGSLLPTAVNVAQGVGWTIFELLVIATAAAALSDELLGFRAQWLWTIVFGACALVLALLGPIGFVRRFIRASRSGRCRSRSSISPGGRSTGPTSVRCGTPRARGALGLAGRRRRRRDHRLLRAVRRGRHAVLDDASRRIRGNGPRVLRADAWLLALGVVLVLSRDLGDPAALPAAVVAGGFAAIVALFALLVTETDEAFANAYSAAVSLQNAFPRAPQELLIVLVTAVATAGALIVDIGSYQSFLLLLGSVFVPLFAVLLADWLAAGAHYGVDDVFGAPAWRWGLIGAWIAGFALYQWLYPTGPAWWVDLVAEL